MGTWLPGVPYTAPTPDQITDEANDDRTDLIEQQAGAAFSELPTIAAGTLISGIIPIQVAAGTRQIPFDPGFSLHDLGQTRGSTTSELGTQAAPFSIPANCLAVGDRLLYTWAGTIANVTGGGGITFRLRPKVNSTAFLDYTITLGALTGHQVVIRSELLVAGLSPSPLVHHGTTLFHGTGSAVGSAFPTASTAGTVLTPPTTSAITVDTTTQMSATGSISTICTFATLARIPGRAA